MKVILLFVLLCLVCIVETSAYRAPDSCLKRIYIKHAGRTFELEPNPDSIRADSCLGSPTFGEWYAKRRFSITTDAKLLNWGVGSIDTGWINNNWQDILPQYDALKKAFKNLETSYGIYKIRRRIPIDVTDTLETSIYSRVYYIEFENYVPVDNVRFLFAKMPNVISAIYQDRTVPLTSIEIPLHPTNESFIRIRNNLFRVPMLSQDVSVKIYDLMGSIIYSNSLDDFEELLLPSDLPIGIYYIQIDTFLLEYFNNP